MASKIDTCKCPARHPLFPFQQECVDEAVENNDHLLLADDMGLGKTIEALKIVEHLNLLPCLLLVPKSLRLKWRDEIHHWTNFPVVLNDEDNDQGLEELVKNPNQIFILHHDILSLLDRKPWLTLFQQIAWKVVIVDEAHRFRNYGTNRGDALLRFKRTQKWLFLTGTPIVNSTLDVYPLVHLMRPNTPNFASPNLFISKFCTVYEGQHGPQVVGSKNVNALFDSLDGCYIRREKGEVLKDLPPKLSSTLTVRLDGLQKSLYDGFEHLLTLLLDNGEELSSPNVLSALTRLRQLSIDPRMVGKNIPGAKTQAVLDIIEGSSQKLVVFSTFAQFIDVLEKELWKREIPFVRCTGSDDATEASNRFNRDSIPKVYISTMKKGEGIDLTSAQTVIIVDHWWNRATENQAIDRLHRIGQVHSNIQAITLHAEGTIDQYMEEVLKRKDAMVNELNVQQEVLRELWQAKKEPQYQTKS